MAFPKEFQELLDQVKISNPELSYQEKMKLASSLYQQARESRDSGVTAPDEPKTAVKPDFAFDTEEITRKIRERSGKAHIEDVMMRSFVGLSPTLVVDGKDGVNTLCHIEVKGFRIPENPGDHFKYFG